ncbi:hypothetical protein [Catellatospora citrea]|uniref:Uncharacterized protein n=1 Tax=Catellatospora citrea TaxID=53366 RepID=A0A8J3KQG4_9ACTN|nr:hypothetical protein [Catellatospora citrea]RKE00332.1 hypothetical protein C8E86_8201 [Catellatospora citrea]GIF99459.1 hypothetical protein Cci01nite_45530 [Catellatospora citrea]
MVTRVCAALLRVAARRWPAEIRADLHREWQAELHVLAEQGRAAPMLAYAVSLALSRPAADPVLDRSSMTGPVLRTAAFLLLAPPAATVAAGLGLWLMSLTAHDGLLRTRPDLALHLREATAALFVTCFAVLLAVLAARLARWGVPAGPLPLAIGLVVPCGITVAMFIATFMQSDKLWRVLPELVLWSAGMVGVLWLAARAAALGHLRLAWCVGLLGAFVVADLGVVLTVLNHTPVRYLVEGGFEPGVSGTWALLWLPMILLGPGLGWGPSQEDVLYVGDLVELSPYLFLAFTPYLLAYAVATARRSGHGPARLVGDQAGRIS